MYQDDTHNILCMFVVKVLLNYLLLPTESCIKFIREALEMFQLKKKTYLS